jgi:hypothetical protein
MFLFTPSLAVWSTGDALEFGVLKNGSSRGDFNPQNLRLRALPTTTLAQWLMPWLVLAVLALPVEKGNAGLF